MARRRHPEDDMQAATRRAYRGAQVSRRRILAHTKFKPYGRQAHRHRRAARSDPAEKARLPQGRGAICPSLHRGNFYAIELKAGDRARPTVEQMKFISDVNAAGGTRL